MKSHASKRRARSSQPVEPEAPASLMVVSEPPRAIVTIERLREGITPELVARLRAEADATDDTLKPADLGMPLAIYLAEAYGVAATLAKYWHSPDPARCPSLSAFASRLPEATIAELVYLVDRVQLARDAARSLVVRADAAMLERASFVYRELRAAARFDAELEADPGARAEKEHRLDVLEASHEADPGPHAMLADALGAFGAYAREYEAAFSAIPGLDPDIVGEAVRLTDALRLRHVRDDVGAKLAARTRDVYVTLLQRRVSMARKVFRYAYRAHPAIVREVTSTYERNRRRRTRSAAAARAPSA